MGSRPRIGRPLEAALAEADELLRQWGEETDSAGLYSDRTPLHPIARMMRDGLYGAPQQSGIAPLSVQSEIVDRAVKLLPSPTRRVISLWYGSSDRFNQTLCLKRLRIPAMEFKWRLRYGREHVFEYYSQTLEVAAA